MIYFLPLSNKRRAFETAVERPSKTSFVILALNAA